MSTSSSKDLQSEPKHEEVFLLSHNACESTRLAVKIHIRSLKKRPPEIRSYYSQIHTRLVMKLHIGLSKLSAGDPGMHSQFCTQEKPFSLFIQIKLDVWPAAKIHLKSVPFQAYLSSSKIMPTRPLRN